MKYSSKTPMLESRKQKVLKVIKSLLEKTQKVEKYHQTLVYLLLNDFIKFIEKCIQGNTEGGLTLKLFTKLKHKERKKIKIFPYVIFPTKTQKKQMLRLSIYEPFFKITEQQPIS